MKLGDDTIGLRKREVVGRNAYGNDITEDVDTEVPWCSVTPARSQNRENDERTTPRVTGLELLAPPGTPVEAADAIIWPITGRQTVDGKLKLTGRTYEVDGEAGVWDECVEAQLRRTS